MKLIRTLSVCSLVLGGVFSVFAQGSSTGEAKNYDSRRTKGIVDKGAPKVFEDVVKGSGLESFKCVSGGVEKEYILEATACVVAVFDYDGDGNRTFTC